MTDPPESQVLAFEGFYVDARQRLLFNDKGETLPLASRAFDTLLFLARHPHELIDKERLMKAVWPKAIVEENNLSQHISLIRKVLGEAPNQHRFIVTVPGRGFRFAPKVQPLESLPWLANPAFGSAPAACDPVAPTAQEPPAYPGEPSGSTASDGRTDAVAPRHHVARWWMWAGACALVVISGIAFRGVFWQSAPTAAPSIAVLAFADLSPGRDQEYFSDGLADELINQLAQIPGLRVIGRTSSFAFKGRHEDSRRIGEILGVDHILDGSVSKFGDRVRIRALLINAADGTQVWAETYERKLDDIFAIRDEISHTVAARLQLKLGVQDLNAGGTRNIAAYDEYLAGRAMLNSAEYSTLRGAAPRLEHAVMLDPDFTFARLWLIDAYLRTLLGSAELKGETIRMQDAMIDEIVRRAPGKPESSFAMSYRAARGRDLAELERLLKDAMRIQGSVGTQARLRYGQFLLAAGHSRAALRELERVQRDDPLNDFGREQLLIALEQAAPPGEAEREIARFLSSPRGNVASIHGLAISLAQGKKDPRALRSAIQAAIDSAKSSDESIHRWNQMLTDPAGALRLLRRKALESQLQGDVYFASNIAQDAAFLGDTGLALQGLTAMLESDFSFEAVAWVLWRPVMRDARRDPRFKTIVRDNGLETYWRRTGQWGDSCKPVGAADFECR